MSHDYVLDTFGRFRKRKTRFTELEKDAVALLNSFVEGSMDEREFAKDFDEIRKRHIELMGGVIDEDTPLWLNSLLGGHFMKWCTFQEMKWYFEAHPEELVGETKIKYEEILRMKYHERFVSVCKSVLIELKKVEEEHRKEKKLWYRFWQVLRGWCRRGKS